MPLEAILAPLRGGSMHDSASELRRIHLLRTSVNKHRQPPALPDYYGTPTRYGGDVPSSRPGIGELSASVSDPPGRPPRLKPRPHKLGGLGLDERKHTAIGGDEHVDLRTIRKGEGACAIRLDSVRAGDGLLTRNLPVKVGGNDTLLLTVAVKHAIPCNGERGLVIIPLDFDPIKGERIRAVKSGLRALRP